MIAGLNHPAQCGNRESAGEIFVKLRNMCYVEGMKLQTLLVISAFLTISCASTNIDREAERLARFADDPRFGAEVNSVCFKGAIQDFRENTRDSVIVRRGVSEDYVLFVDQCRDLEDANALAFQSSQSCVRPFDRLSVFQQGIGGLARDVSPNVCRIEAIYKWDEAASSDEDALTKP
jgi:hypothetical protein